MHSAACWNKVELKNMMAKFGRFCWIFVLVILHNSLGAEGETFPDLVARFWQWQQDLSPEVYSVWAGLDYHSTRVENYTRAARQAVTYEAQDLLASLTAIDRNSVGEDQLLNYDIFNDTLYGLIEGFEFVDYGPSNPFNLNNNYFSTWIGYVNKALRERTAGSIDKILQWYRQLPEQINQIMQNMDNSIAMGTTHHNYSMTGVLERFDAELGKPQENSTFMKPFKDDYLNTLDIDDGLRSTVKDTGQLLVPSVIAAWQELRNYLLNVYLPHTRQHEGVWSLPRGEEYYRACLRWYLSDDITPQEIHDLGLREVQRILGEMEKIKKADGFTGTVKEFISHLKSQASNFYSTPDELLQGYKDIVDNTHNKLNGILKTVTEVKCVVVDNENPNAPEGLYSAAPLDKSRPARFVANVHDPSGKVKFDMVALTMHECEPGHHTQFSYLTESDSFPLFRRARSGGLDRVPFIMPKYSAMIEGWALYAEAIAGEIGAYVDSDRPFSNLGRYTSEMYRACRLVVDTGIHSLRWTKARAAEYFANYTSMGEYYINNEMNRYISWPGQACSYKIGQLKISQLRTYAMDKLGDQFDKREFHDTIIKLGPVPLRILDARIKQWVHDVYVHVPETSASTSVTAATSVLIMTVILTFM